MLSKPKCVVFSSLRPGFCSARYGEDEKARTGTGVTVRVESPSTTMELWQIKRSRRLRQAVGRTPDGAGGRCRGPESAEGYPSLYFSVHCLSKHVFGCRLAYSMRVLRSTFPAGSRSSRCYFQSVTQRWNSVSQRPGSDRQQIHNKS
ncbi:hypothetical protein KCU59_g10, partial [Aureobasidium melanogenum]